MVSGAGGSIGSELCRQIVRLGPTRLLLVEMSEPALYHIDRELRLLCKGRNLDVEIVPLIGNAHHRNRVREIMQRFGVQTVYHAAAYKHVPIVEQNVIEGIHIMSSAHGTSLRQRSSRASKPSFSSRRIKPSIRPM
jgi:FlaA1/EpsC-like NDP-sugar epimerase